MKYNAFVVRKSSEGTFEGEVESLDTQDLPEGEVLIKVQYSSLNFKDALSFNGNAGVTKQFPHTPGIDAVGEVVESSAPAFKVGDDALVIGYDLGMNTPGGFGEYIRIPKEWAIALPSNLSAQASMEWGTAGFTAALCIEKLLAHGLKKEQGPVLVSGSSGGVGSTAILLLKKLGFEVHALTSKPNENNFFEELGVDKVVPLNEFLSQSKRPVLKAIYSGAIDVAGGDVLATMLKCIHYGGAVSCCGLAASTDLNTSVLPFILRGISLLGIDSVELPLSQKKEMWDKIANEWSLSNINSLCQEITKGELSESLQLILNAKVKGRFILTHK